VFGDAEVSGGARVFGDAWVFGGARVFGDAEVSGGARVFGDAWVSKRQDLLVIGPVGSRNAHFTVIIPSGKVKVGCFEGTLDDLEAAATEAQRQDYLDLLPGIRAIVARRQAAKE
jgi:hypothetical protein